MESYIPLVKAIIISTMFSWGTSEVVITEQYILKESIQIDQVSGDEKKDYQVYDLRKEVAYVFDSNLNFRNIVSIDSLKRYEEQRPKTENSDKVRILKTSFDKKKFDGYSCKLEVRDKEDQDFLDAVKLFRYSDISCFAKIPWLDKILDTNDKREFAGFWRQEYSPYHYLVYEVFQYSNITSGDQVFRFIEKTETDTSFIHTLLSLPIKGK